MSHDSHPSHTHIASIGQYGAIFAALMVLSYVTVAVSKIDFGVFNLFVAMAIAVTKATLVVLFFMHLWWSPKLNKLTFATAFVFFGILVAFTMSDYLGRGVFGVLGK
jgi:cytochrome c oxidase subunit 4